jgi:hypothetical protein
MQIRTLRLAVALACCSFGGVALAGTAAIQGGTYPMGGGATTPTPIAITYAGDGTTDGFETTVQYPAASMTAVTVAAANGGSCSVNTATGVITVLAQDGALNALPAAATTYCNVTFTVGNVPGPIALNVTGTLQSNDGAPSGTALVETDATLTVFVGPQPPTLNYNPAPGALTVPASLTPGTATVSVAITTTGGDVGQTRALACGTIPTGYTAVVTGSPFGPGGTGSIGIGCTGTPAAGNLVCTETPGGATRTYNLTCSSLPGYSSVPPIGGTVTLSGIQGGPATGGISVTNNGTAPLSITSCTPGGTAGFTVTSTFPIAIAAGATGSINLGCTAPAAAGTSITGGTLTCATNAPGAGAAPNYNLTCSALSASIPTLGWGGKGLMVLLMLGLGLVGFQLYRRTA